ncbi:hypothetical protein H2204_005164, partial [Knufia peltigerae]
LCAGLLLSAGLGLSAGQQQEAEALDPMNYSNMTTAALQPASGSISLPPISSIEFQSQIAHHRSSPEVVQPLPPPPPTAPRVLPPLPYPPYGARPAMVPPPPPPPVPHGYIDTRPLYPGLPTAYQPMPGRMPLPSSADPSLIVHPPRHKAKEVKRRTKTGCLTCRKRRIKMTGRVQCVGGRENSTQV